MSTHPTFHTNPEVFNRLKQLAFVAGALPFVAIHASYLIAATEGYVDWCVPYWDSCTSISKTGREGIAYVWFKVTMIPAAVVIFLFWRQLYKWQSLSVFPANKALMIVGCIGAVCLAIYTFALGEAGDLFRRQRQVGATVYFTFTYLAQLMLVAWLLRHGVKSFWRNYMLASCVACLVIGIISLVIEANTYWHDDVEDAIEWILAFIIDVNFLAFFAYLLVLERCGEHRIDNARGTEPNGPQDS